MGGLTVMLNETALTVYGRARVTIAALVQRSPNEDLTMQGPARGGHKRPPGGNVIQSERSRRHSSDTAQGARNG